MELHAYLRLRGQVGPPRWDEALAWQAAHTVGVWSDGGVSVDDFRPERGINRPQPEPGR